MKGVSSRVGPADMRVILIREYGFYVGTSRELLRQTRPRIMGVAVPGLAGGVGSEDEHTECPKTHYYASATHVSTIPSVMQPQSTSQWRIHHEICGG